MFTTKRKLDTGDETDFNVLLDTQYVMCYSYKSTTANFDRKHDKWGLWDIHVDSTGKVSRTGVDLQQFYRSADHE